MFFRLINCSDLIHLVPKVSGCSILPQIQQKQSPCHNGSLWTPQRRGEAPSKDREDFRISSTFLEKHGKTRQYLAWPFVRREWSFMNVHHTVTIFVWAHIATHSFFIPYILGPPKYRLVIAQLIHPWRINMEHIAIIEKSIIFLSKWVIL